MTTPMLLTQTYVLAICRIFSFTCLAIKCFEVNINNQDPKNIIILDLSKKIDIFLRMVVRLVGFGEIELNKGQNAKNHGQFSQLKTFKTVADCQVRYSQ